MRVCREPISHVTAAAASIPAAAARRAANDAIRCASSSAASSADAPASAAAATCAVAPVRLVPGPGRYHILAAAAATVSIPPPHLLRHIRLCLRMCAVLGPRRRGHPAPVQSSTRRSSQSRC